MSTAPVMQPGSSLAHDRKPQRHSRGSRVRTHRTHSTTNYKTQTSESPIVYAESESTSLIDSVVSGRFISFIFLTLLSQSDPAFNPKSILPTTKSTKSLGRPKKHLVAC